MVFEVGKHVVQFHCDHAVFAAGGTNSVCYCTSEERAAWLANKLNEHERITEELAKLRAENERQKPVVQAAIAYRTNDAWGAFHAFVRACDAYQAAEAPGDE